MKKISSLILALATISLAFWACQKEYSVETGGNPDTGSANTFGWEMAGNGTSFSGCIDTAYYATLSGNRGVAVEMFSNAGDELRLALPAATGNVAVGSYNLLQGALIQFTTAAGDVYQPAATGTSTTITVTTSNDTLIEGSFSATLKLNGTGADYLITNGKFKAKIGMANPCGGTTPTTPTSAYTIPTCAAITTQGTYTQGSATGAANTVTIPVNVTTIGTWTVTTTAVNGLTFTGSGTFTTTGAQNIILSASGTPTVSGANSIAVTAGSTNCTFSVNVAVGSGTGDEYFPTTQNSWWSYNVPLLTDTVTFRSVETETISGNSFRKFRAYLNLAVEDSAYFRKSSGDYFQYTTGDFYSNVSFDTDVFGEINFLKTNLTLNQTWNSATITGPVGGVSTDIRYLYTVTAVGATEVLGGKTYNNVIKVSCQDQLKPTTASTFTNGTKTSVYWYAKDIGIVYSMVDVPQTIRNYKVF